MSATHIQLIGPSGYPHDHAAMQRGVTRLRATGAHIVGEEVLARVETRFAGSDAERGNELNALAKRETLPDIVLAVRGGYGATRLLEQLDYGALRERLSTAPTALVGHSDFTALQLALFAQAGLITFAGPMLGPDFGAAVVNDLTWTAFWETLTRPIAQAVWPTADADGLDVQGPLWGGNLAMLCSLLDTPYFPRIDDGILFIEDVGEPPFRIERWLYQLKLSGVLERQQALLLGDFSRCGASAYDNGYDLDAAFAQLRRVTRMPIIAGLPMGHEAAKFTLPFGVPARLRVASGHARLDFSGHPYRSGAVPPIPAENP